MPTPRTCLLIIDPQNDFHEGGSLAVPGALADSARVADLLREHGDSIDTVIVTLDTHHKLHIAHAAFWKDASGSQPTPFTIITFEDISSGAWTPRNGSNREAALSYARSLEQKGRFQICIWPEHCLIGTPGHAVVPCINSALQEWSEKRVRTVEYILKGMNCMTEMYSAIKAEVVLRDDASTDTNVQLVETLRGHDRIICCGQALSHCVNFTVRDLVEGLGDVAASEKVIILSDGSSPVTGFEASAAAFVDDMKTKKVRMSRCKQVFDGSAYTR